MGEVYCENCEYYKEDSRFCNYVKDVKIKKTPTEKIETEIYAQPKKDNKNNDCEYYEEKSSLLSIALGEEYYDSDDQEINMIVAVYKLFLKGLNKIYQVLFVKKSEIKNANEEQID